MVCAHVSRHDVLITLVLCSIVVCAYTYLLAEKINRACTALILRVVLSVCVGLFLFSLVMRCAAHTFTLAVGLALIASELPHHICLHVEHSHFCLIDNRISRTLPPIGLRCDQASGLFFVKNSSSGGPILAALGVQFWPQIWDSGGRVLAPNFGAQMDSLGVQKWRRIWDQKWPLLFELKKGGPEMATDFEQKLATDFGPKTHPQIPKWIRILDPRWGFFWSPKWISGHLSLTQIVAHPSRASE